MKDDGMIKKSQQKKEGFFQGVEKVSQRVKKKYLWCMEKLQWFGEFVTSTPILSIFLIIAFLLFLASLDIGVFSPSLFPDNVAQFITVKIIGPTLGLVFGFLLFAQRLDVMNKQAELIQSQHEADLFKQACELLGHEKIVIRLGGITLLGALARTDPETWHVVAVDALALFIRQRSTNDENSPVKVFPELLKTEEKDEKEAEEKWQKLSESKNNKTPIDIEKAMGMIACDLTKEQKNVVQEHHKSNIHWPDLRGSWLCFTHLAGAYLPKASLSNSFLHGIAFIEADLTGAMLTSTHLDGALFAYTNLQDTLFGLTNVTDAHFEQSLGLKKPQLTGCYYIEGEQPPVLPEKIESPDPTSIKNYWKNIHAVYRKQNLKFWQALGDRAEWFMR